MAFSLARYACLQYRDERRDGHETQRNRNGCGVRVSRVFPCSMRDEWNVKFVSFGEFVGCVGDCWR